MTDQTGLTMKEVRELRKSFGRNEITVKQGKSVLTQIKHICSEPIYLLLACSAIIYFILGDMTDGMVMIFFVLFVIGINLFQDIRTGNALKKLKAITDPQIEVIREDMKCLIPKEELLPGDLVLLYEGVKIPADGHLVYGSGLAVDESILTGEASAVWKEVRCSQEEQAPFGISKDRCYAGTSVTLGSGRMLVDRIGNNTEYGKIAEKLAGSNRDRSLLQRQMGTLARQCSYFAAILFFLVGGVTFWNLAEYELSHRLVHSMLAGVVLALSMVPGEFPVILSVYFSLGALRLARKKALIRRLSAIEALGSVSVLCLDKTGTITHNCLSVSDACIAQRQESKFCSVLALACKRETHDPVEHALLDYGEQLCSRCSRRLHGNKVRDRADAVMACSRLEEGNRLIKEYPFSNETRVMGQLWLYDNKYILAAKGSPEAILSICTLTKTELHELEQKLEEYSGQGLKVIALADAELEMNEIPEVLSECRLSFRGMLALADPPRESIDDCVKACYHAGIRILMITGDYPLTAAAVAKKVGIRHASNMITGDELEQMTDEELCERVKSCNVYARVLPLHKMRIVQALKNNGEVVAMTGDGVNDSTAQKAADIGIAMGKNGSEVTRDAADIILLDDNFSTILDTICDGRRIYQNILKTIAYVLAFHIPIALICLVTPLLGIGPQSLLLMPLHIVLLELVMDPTVSITLERQPAEPDTMRKSPRSPSGALVSAGTFIKCLLQGGVIFCSSFCLYFGMLNRGFPAETARTCGFTVLVLSSIFLVLVNCSEEESLFSTIRRLWPDKGIWVINLGIPGVLFLLIYTPLHEKMGFAPLSISNLVITIVLSLAAVMWYEIVKLFRRLLRE